jgi:hypothetical protein
MHSTAQGVYVIVTMTVRNLSDQAQSYFDTDQILKDSTGRMYSPDTTAETWISERGQIEINPRDQLQVKSVFDVPEGNKPTELDVRESTFSTVPG